MEIKKVVGIMQNGNKMVATGGFGPPTKGLRIKIESVVYVSKMFLFTNGDNAKRLIILMVVR